LSSSLLKRAFDEANNGLGVVAGESITLDKVRVRAMDADSAWLNLSPTLRSCLGLVSFCFHIGSAENPQNEHERTSCAKIPSNSLLARLLFARLLPDF
jgi:hypothetical protein